jgi:hypothetical protein
MSDEAKNGRTSSASISSFDPRVSRGISLFMASLGVVAVGVVGWVAISINELNVNVARLVTRLDSKEFRDNTQDTRISRTEDRVEDLNSAVRTLEGRNLRGGMQDAESASQIIQVESSKLTPLNVALSATALLVAGIALGISINNQAQSSQAQADMRSRYEQSYRELATKVALNTNATDDMRASLIARGINPNNHDITDVGGNKP